MPATKGDIIHLAIMPEGGTMPDPTIHLGTAAEATIEGGEEGFEVHLTSAGGVRYVMNIHGVASDLHAEVNREIGAWLAEAAEAWSMRPVTDDDAYPPNDPKRSSWHSVHADLYDDERQGQR